MTGQARTVGKAWATGQMRKGGDDIVLDEKTISLNYIKKLELPGSDSGIRFMFRKEERSKEADQKETVLCCYIWPEPYGFAATDPARISSRDFPLTEEGKKEAVDWINEQHCKNGF